MWIHSLLGVSNLLGVPALIAAVNHSKWIDFVVVSSVMSASTLMHLTENKHDLSSPYLKQWSRLFLNLDRVAAIGATLYFGYQIVIVFPGWCWLVRMSVPMVVGTICVILGERKTTSVTWNRICYPILHLIWHYTVYFTMWILINSLV